MDGEKIDAPNTIIKALVSKSNKAELLGADKAEQAQVRFLIVFFLTHLTKIDSLSCKD